ncbi:MAG: serine/threonine protein kinase, partial [Pseudanabaena sp.]
QINKPSADDDPSGLLTNFAIGTPGFAPPEQMAMRPVYSSDLYATAMSCLYLMTGQSPKELPHDPYTGEINWKGNVKLSNRMMFIFEKLLQQSVSQRFRSAEEALKALESSGISEDLPKAAIFPKISGQVASNHPSVTIKDTNTQQLNSRIQAQKYSNTQGWDSGMLSAGNTRAVATNRFGGELKGGRKVIFEY